MKQPEYLVLNPVFNKFPKDLITHRYIAVNEPYIDIFNEIRWHRIKKFQSINMTEPQEFDLSQDSFEINKKIIQKIP